MVNRTNTNKIKGVTAVSTSSLGTTKDKLFVNKGILDHIFQIVVNNFPTPVDGVIHRDFLARYRCKINYDKWTG